MKLIRWSIAVIIVLIGYSAYTQNLPEQILMTLGDEKVTCSEFERIYLKNNQNLSSIDRKSVDEYLGLFINYKLKVLEAKSLKMDTSATFKNEYLGYRKQLALPYLNDSETEQQLIDEAFQRMKSEISASHILIAIPEQATSDDTARLYEKIIAVRNRIINGEPFEVVARATSDDPSVKNNNGYLGYFTVFQMVYPFETAAYSTPVGSLSMPIRTRYGYHIIKVQDVRPARGQVKVAHIMIAVPRDASQEQQQKSKQQIDEIYQHVLSNEDFASLAKQYSQDPGSAKNGGELPWFGTGRMIPDFEQVAFAMTQDGQISEPFQTSFGWHIVKRLGRKEVGTYEEMLPEIKKKISGDMRYAVSREKMISKIKKENSFIEDTNNVKVVGYLLDSTIYKGTWKVPVTTNNKTIFTLAGKPYTQSDFAVYIGKNQKKPYRGDFNHLVKSFYNDWVKDEIVAFEDARLEQKHPDFRYLMQEYYDGILLFDLTDKMVWSKATRDTLGLENFFKAHQENYRWGERVYLAIYSCPDDKIAQKTAKSIAKRKDKNISPEQVVSKLNKGQALINLEHKIVNIDDEQIRGHSAWVNGISGICDREGKKVIYEIVKITNGDNKTLDECRGLVVSDFQQFLEGEWLNTLKLKYPVTINSEVLNKLIEKMSKK